MYGRLGSFCGISILITASAFAQPYQRRAQIVGGGNPDRGKCTIEVVIDGAAEVEIRGDTGTLRNLSGQPPQWRRFECTSAMPANARFSAAADIGKTGRRRVLDFPSSQGIRFPQ